MSTQLPHDCYVGKISVIPANWETSEDSIDEDWIIHYRFHDPNFKDRYPKGYPKQIRGMNGEKTLAGRRKVTRDLIKNELEQLRSGYNPILGKIVPTSDLVIIPSTPLPAALEKAFSLLEQKPATKEVRKALPHLLKACSQLKYHLLAVSDTEQHHLEILLMQVKRNKDLELQQPKPPRAKSKHWRPSRERKEKRAQPMEWGAASFNHYRSYLQMLFKVLKRVGATKTKPVDDIEKKSGIKTSRIGLTKEDWQKLESLRSSHYTFYRLIRIFHRSGTRGPELMGVQPEHVQLEERRFRVLVKKGKGSWEWKLKTITADVLAFWQEVMEEYQEMVADLKPEDEKDSYLFSHDLRPGPVRISPRQLTERWLWHVKEKLGIRADFYALKHDNTTKVIDMALRKIEEATKVAAEVNGHTGTTMNKKHYDLEADERLHHELSKMGS